MKPKLLGVVWCYGLFNVHYEYVHNRIKNVLIHSTSVIGSSIIAWLGLQSYEVFLLTLQLDLLYLLYIYICRSFVILHIYIHRSFVDVLSVCAFSTTTLFDCPSLSSFACVGILSTY